MMDENRGTKAKTLEQEDRDLLNRLLGCNTIEGSLEEVSCFRIRVGELADLNGEEWVRRNSERILAQCEMALKLNREDTKGR